MSAERPTNSPAAAAAGFHFYRAALLLCALGGTAFAQRAQAPTSPDATNSPVQMQQKLQQLSTDLAAAQERLQQSQKEIQRLQDELSALQAQFPAQSPATPSVAAAPPVPTPADLNEKVDILEAEVKQHEQTKVESISKYSVHLTGLVLFNSFIVKGGVDNLDLPSYSIQPTPGMSDLVTGASVRQTILGVRATGPHVFGAQTSGDVNVDFFGGPPYSNFGTTGGTVRMRTASVRLLWDRDTAELGLVEPLISPLSPTSYASVAEPSLAWAGNLWTWAPQFSYEHRFGAATTPHLALQAGLWDSPTAGYNTDSTIRTAGPGESSGQPAYETRLSYARDDQEDGLQFGVGGYYSRQSYPGRSGDSWAVTGDWRLPLGRIFELSGEAYRGRALGGLGGGVYKDVVSGNNPVTGVATFHLLNATGGWSQAKFHMTRTLEANGAFGLDNGFSRDFRSLILPAGATNTALRARNQMATVNLVYSPKTYLIVSPEFRRIWTWPISGSAATANIFTMTFGLRF